jgi:predicted branched-subunit amino acid permease
MRHVRLSWVAKGAAAALSLPAWTVAIALSGIGSLARDVGHPLGAAVLSTLIVWAGPAQIIFYGGIAAGLSPPALALAVGLSSIRFVPMVISILPLLQGEGPSDGRGRAGRLPVASSLLASHYVAVTVWTESLRRLPLVPPPYRFPFYLGFANACLFLSAAGTGLGYVLAGALPLPLAAGMLFVSPIFFTISVAAGARRLTEWLAIALGFLLEPAFRWLLGDGIDLLVVGVAGGTAAFMVGRFREADA